MVSGHQWIFLYTKLSFSSPFKLSFLMYRSRRWMAGSIVWTFLWLNPYCQMAFPRVRTIYSIPDLILLLSALGIGNKNWSLLILNEVLVSFVFLIANKVEYSSIYLFVNLIFAFRSVVSSSVLSWLIAHPYAEEIWYCLIAEKLLAPQAFWEIID
jgi:hypothetical protein